MCKFGNYVMGGAITPPPPPVDPSMKGGINRFVCEQ